MSGDPTRLYLRIPPWGAPRLKSLIYDRDWAAGSHATTFPLNHRQVIQFIHCVIHAAIPFSFQGLRSVRGLKTVTIAFLFDRALGEAGGQF